MLIACSQLIAQQSYISWMKTCSHIDNKKQLKNSEFAASRDIISLYLSNLPLPVTTNNTAAQTKSSAFIHGLISWFILLVSFFHFVLLLLYLIF